MDPKLNNIWWLRQLRQKPEKLVVKLYDDDEFIDAVNIPSVMWPLNGKPEMFHHNCCEPIEDAAVTDLVNSIPYCVGECYSNAGAVTDALCAAGYQAKTYVGWLFVSGTEYPLHHAWTVLDGIHVIDLEDDFALIAYSYNKFVTEETEYEADLLIDEFQEWAQTNLKHSERCQPFGVPAAQLLYVGAENTPLGGICEFQNLVAKYPDHPILWPTDEIDLLDLMEN